MQHAFRLSLSASLQIVTALVPEFATRIQSIVPLVKKVPLVLCQSHARCYNGGNLTPDCSSRETLPVQLALQRTGSSTEDASAQRWLPLSKESPQLFDPLVSSETCNPRINSRITSVAGLPVC
ncbi:MAG: hypothetical protein KME31_31380 [Tolypothrix carrinoi HA7290-LM1]|nr:hypothetical protein [Tolypothrix carrinoi HA7290-LM1]